jgi:hypothetical protein
MRQLKPVATESTPHHTRDDDIPIITRPDIIRYASKGSAAPNQHCMIVSFLIKATAKAALFVEAPLAETATLERLRLHLAPQRRRSPTLITGRTITL